LPKLFSVLLTSFLFVAPSFADPVIPELARRVAERPANDGRVGTMHFRLTNSAGKVRERTALMAHSEAGDVVRLAIFFTAPSMISETAFLSFDHASREDESWLFLPATERVRRLPVSERRDYFMGTDMTYGDVKDNFKFSLSDWTFETDGTSEHKSKTYPVLTGQAISPAIAEELGYTGFRALVDEETCFPVLIEFSDTDGAPLKRVEVTDLANVGDAWTAMAFVIEQLQTGHRTEVVFTDMRRVPDIDDSVFDPTSLAYGTPEIG
jgi:outer membrane lipoprotein-sorting protein